MLGRGDDVWAQLAEANARLKASMEELRERRAALCCVECGVRSTGSARGWRTYLTIDDEVATYCPACAHQEFGRA